MDEIVITGARQHNLKNITVRIPKNKLVVMTGLSGSGKSSLAFDTLYAEGQRRYVESLSAYARQFLGIMDKPDVDSIVGLSPAISIDQKSSTHNPRSTVGTVTEIYDYLRLLFARVGTPHCPKCGGIITRLTLDEISGRLFKQLEARAGQEGTRPVEGIIYSPVVRGKKGEFVDLFDSVRAKGFSTVQIDGKTVEIQNGNPDLLKQNKHDIRVQIDRLMVQKKDFRDEIYAANLRSRITTAVEQALALSDGLVVLTAGGQEQLLSEKLSCPKCSISLPEIEPRMFSFNSPIGACASCKGLGTVYKIDADLILNKNLSINEGGIIPFTKIFFQDTWYIRLLKRVCEEEGIDQNIPLKDIAPDKLKILLFGTQTVYRVVGQNRFGNDTAIHEKFLGLVAEFERRFFESQSGTDELEVGRYMREETCGSCKGKRLKPEVLAITVGDQDIMQLCSTSVEKMQMFFMETVSTLLTAYEREIAQLIIREIASRLTFLLNVGLGYLTIDRSAKTLSGGELQRIRLASQIGSGLSGVLYVLDEPSIGLHPKDVASLIGTLKRLRDLGNTVVIVEHDKETIENADYMIELGPKAGKNGGHVTFQGDIAAARKPGASLTGDYLSGKRSVRQSERKLNSTLGMLVLQGASEHNLRSVNLELPLGNLIAVTGVSGSGKSTLITETLYPALKYYLDGYYQEHMGEYTRLLGYQLIERVYLVDQSPIGRTPRSNPATYTGMFDEIREIFAQTVEARSRGFKKGRFSFNMKGGRCEKCQGAGVNRIQMQFMPDVYVTCDICDGHRYNHDTLQVTFKGKSIYDVLNMTIDEAVGFFGNHPRISTKLQFLTNVGLGYVTLGQPATTFSGGEAQRIKLAHELSRKDKGKTLYLLDEPTTGLHMWDVDKLLHTLHELVDAGNTVVVIEHNLDVIRNAQYVVDLGPSGGDGGGEIVYQGPTKGIFKEKRSYTAQYLR